VTSTTGRDRVAVLSGPVHPTVDHDGLAVVAALWPLRQFLKLYRVDDEPNLSAPRRSLVSAVTSGASCSRASTRNSASYVLASASSSAMRQASCASLLTSSLCTGSL
jgi:hypothetical protein